MLPLTITAAVGIAPEGRELLFSLKNHSNIGVGESDRVITLAEHSREKLVPAVPVLEPPEEEMVTGPISTVGRENGD